LYCVFKNKRLGNGTFSTPQRWMQLAGMKLKDYLSYLKKRTFRAKPRLRDPRKQQQLEDASLSAAVPKGARVSESQIPGNNR
jgi:hypothetical protein